MMTIPDFYQLALQKGLKPNCAEPDVDPELFFPDPREKGVNQINQQAIAICNRNGGCPVKTTCLLWALDHEEIGTWGGMTETQRRKFKKKLAKASTPPVTWQSDSNHTIDHLSRMK